MSKQQTVHWRKQYALDNFFNIMICCMTIVLVLLDEKYCPRFIIAIPAFVGFFINLSASNYFDTKRFKK